MIKTNGQGFPDDLHQISQFLENGGTILHPGDTFWMVSAALVHINASTCFPPSDNKPFPDKVLLVRDIPMLRQYIIDLHPRVETLLSYHERPLIVTGRPTRHFPPAILNEKNRLCAMITRDPFCLELISRTRSPLVSTPLLNGSTKEVCRFEQISSRIISEVEYVSYYGRYSTRPMETCPVITYDKKGNIHFLSE